MGGKQTRPREHLYLRIAFLIILLLPSCTDLIRVRQHLSQARELVREGKYDQALRVNQKVVSTLGDGPPVDEALFNMALIHAHPDNPARDNALALTQLDRIMDEHPGSDYASTARVWRNLLRENQRLGREVEKRRDLLRRLSDENHKLAGELEQFTSLRQQSENENQKLVEQLEKLQRVILQWKQVDLQIEEKKREGVQ